MALPTFCSVPVFTGSLLRVTGQCWHTCGIMEGATRMCPRQCLNPCKDEEGWRQIRGGTAAQHPLPCTVSPFALPAPCRPPLLMSLTPRLLAHPHLLFGLPSWPPLQRVAWLLLCVLALWQSCCLIRHLRDCWFRWLSSLFPASSLPGFRPSTEPTLCFWKHPNSSSQLPGETFLTKARLSYN